MRPKRAAARLTASRAAPGSATSSCNAYVRCGCRSTSGLIESGSRAVATTRSPCSKAAALTARPKPLDAPVTNQTRSCFRVLLTMNEPSFRRLRATLVPLRITIETMRLQFGIFDWVEASRRSPAAVYDHKLELASAAERAGFHGMFIAEHHGTPLSIDGSPAALLSAIFQRTRRLRAGALTFCLPWYHPYRLYSEVCMLDQLSRGRLELGVGRGVSPIESRIFGLNSVEESRERYRATLETFFAACRSDTMRINGQDAELHVKPKQKPYPPLWFPSSNKESIEFTA